MFSVVPLHKNATEKSCNFIKKETLAQVFSCEFFEVSKNTFSYRTPLVAASEIYVLHLHILSVFKKLFNGKLVTHL